MMKKNILKMILMLTGVSMLLIGFVSCGDPSNNNDDQDNPNGQIVITDAASLAKALKCDVTEYVYETENGSRSAMPDNHNKVEINVNNMMKNMVANSSSFMVLNAIASSSNVSKFDEEITMQINSLPSFFDIVLETTGMNAGYMLKVFNGSKIKMSKLGEDEYDIVFKYGYGNYTSTAYIYVKGTSSDNLVSWYFENGNSVRTTRTSSNGESKIEIVFYMGEDKCMYTKIGNKNNKNYYENVEIDDSKIKNYGIFNKDKGFVYNSDGDKLYYGLSETNPTLIGTTRKMSKISDTSYIIKYNKKIFFNTYYLENKDTVTINYSENYHECYHAADNGKSICLNYVADPLYYSADEKFYGVEAELSDLTDEAKAVYESLKASAEAVSATDYDVTKYFADKNEYNVIYKLAEEKAPSALTKR